jgi:hypothetical protein
METSIIVPFLGLVAIVFVIAVLANINSVCRRYERIIGDDPWVPTLYEKKEKKMADNKKRKKVISQRGRLQL